MKKVYKVGDWVKATKETVFTNSGYTKVTNREFTDAFNLFEKVTKPWEIMLLELGRKTPEFKPGDVIVTYQDLYLARYHDHDDIVLLFEENLVIRFCPEEHSIEV